VETADVTVTTAATGDNNSKMEGAYRKVAVDVTELSHTAEAIARTGVGAETLLSRTLATVDRVVEWRRRQRCRVQRGDGRRRLPLGPFGFVLVLVVVRLVVTVVALVRRERRFERGAWGLHAYA